MTTEKSIEEKVSETILQKPLEVKIGSKTYSVKPPTVATLIRASAAVSRLPRFTLDKENIVQETLSVAKDCRALGEIAAEMILGEDDEVKTAERKVWREKRCFFGLIKRRYEATETYQVSRKEELAKEILEAYTPTQLFSLMSSLFERMEVQDFFALTTFLIEVNLIRPTKEVGN